jgi:hypothetical protein
MRTMPDCPAAGTASVPSLDYTFGIVIQQPFQVSGLIWGSIVGTSYARSQECATADWIIEFFEKDSSVVFAGNEEQRQRAVAQLCAIVQIHIYGMVGRYQPHRDASIEKSDGFPCHKWEFATNPNLTNLPIVVRIAAHFLKTIAMRVGLSH